MADRRKSRANEKTKKNKAQNPQRTPVSGSVTNYRPERSSQLSADERIINRAKERQRKRKRKALIVRSITCLIFAVVAITVTLLVFFHVNTIEVTGDPVYSDSDIILESGIELGDNLIFVSNKKANNKLIVNMPYIDSVKVKKHLPSTIEINVKETKAVFAVMSEDGSYTLLDKNGKVLESGLEFTAENIMTVDLGKINSMEIGYVIETENEDTIERLRSIYDALIETGLEGITFVDLSNAYDTTLVYEGRITLLLGETTNSNLVDKLALGKSAIDTQNDESTQYKGTLNLTVDKKGYWSEDISTTEAVSEETETVTNENGEIVEEKEGSSDDKTSEEKSETEKSQD